MKKSRTKETQYDILLDLAKLERLQRFGLMSSQVWRDDPRRLGFVLARYKFVAKMLVWCRRVMEVGCAEAFGTRVVRQEVPKVVATDFDPVFIEENRTRGIEQWPVDYRVHDMLAGPLAERFDAAYALANTHPSLKANLIHHRAQDPYPWADKYFDLVISLNTLHNLRLFELPIALAEISRVGDQGYLLVESYRNEQELFNLQCWALTCESFFDVDEWLWLYRHFGYDGDHEFIYF